MNDHQTISLRLITITISHYCEKVRWALDYLNIDYQEEGHAPPFHRKHTGRYGGTTVPVLIVGEKALIDSRDILHYLDTIAPGSKQLYPKQSELRQEVEELEKLFDTQLGVATRCWGYYYGLQQPLQILLAWVKEVPWSEKIGCAIVFPKIPKLLRQKYHATETGKEAALQTIRDIFAIVSQKLEPGQKYLVGNSLSAADITLAALAAPVLRPEHHPVYSSQLSKLPTEMVSIIEELRATPTGIFVLNLYQEQRFV